MAERLATLRTRQGADAVQRLQRTVARCAAENEELQSDVQYWRREARRYKDESWELVTKNSKLDFELFQLQLRYDREAR